jgi:hypothetical protein
MATHTEPSTFQPQPSALPGRRRRPERHTGRVGDTARTGPHPGRQDGSADADRRDPPAQPRRANGFGKHVPVLVGVVGMVTYFAWVCSQMARHAQGGIWLVIAIFAAIGFGVGAMALGLWKGGR